MYFSITAVPFFPLAERQFAAEEVADQRGDLVRMRFQREVARVEQMHFGVGDVAAVGFGAGRQEGCVVLAPDGQQRRLVGAEIRLECRIQGDVAAVVEDQVELYPAFQAFGLLPLLKRVPPAAVVEEVLVAVYLPPDTKVAAAAASEVLVYGGSETECLDEGIALQQRRREVVELRAADAAHAVEQLVGDGQHFGDIVHRPRCTAHPGWRTGRHGGPVYDGKPARI